ncbi:MAG: hypothetical protein H6813_06740 [Phycisphaeraceae bacterium]|nr:hypothetical protein [Phycisphaeraceae bacterium]
MLVEDDEASLNQLARDLPAVFKKNKVEVTLHEYDDFDTAIKAARDPSRRFDLILSDTYKGDNTNRDAQALRLVNEYKSSRFCPLVLFSSGVRPAELSDSPFVLWADKSKAEDVERAIDEVLRTGVPMVACSMRDVLEKVGTKYLWEFLEQSWQALNQPNPIDPNSIERLIRRRAAMQLADIDEHSGAPILERAAQEYYIYPSFEQPYFSLGDVIRHKTTYQFRVILTPHCHLFVQPGQENPRADHVLTLRTLPAEGVLGEKIQAVSNITDVAARHKKLAEWARSPANTPGRPAGRHWYLPAFMQIPHLFCDLMQVESLPFDAVVTDFERVATLTPPYAEALQACFVSFFGSVGIPTTQPTSFDSILSADPLNNPVRDDDVSEV